MILIIDNYDSFTYNLYQGILVHEKEARVCRNDRITINEINELNIDGIILSPGPGRPESAGICVALITAMVNKKFHRQLPLLGVCLGHQAIVQALGGDVIQADEIVHGKDDDIYHHQKGLYQSLSQPFKAGRYHSLSADRRTLPQSLLIEAENKQKMIMGIRHRVLPIYGVQFHPESILTPEGSKFLQSFIEICKAGNRK